MSKLEAFLKENKIDPRRLLAVSARLERLRPEDRAIKLAQTRARKSEDAKKPEGLGKPRSGRPVTAPALNRALRGERIAGPQKTRILRAVNHILESKKQAAVNLAQLFEPGSGGGKKKKAAKE
jgi:hypothetical protein